MKGMILAAGFGTRFRPATYTIPKPLIPLCNRPLIHYAIDTLLGAGISDIVINLHHLGEAIASAVSDAYSRSATIRFSREDETILGTGGGVRAAASELGGDDFVLLNGDTVQFPPLDELMRARRQAGALASLLLRHPPENDRFTKVFFEGGRVTGFGTGQGEPLMFAGAHCISPAIFRLLPDRPVSGIVEDVYIPALRDGTAELAAIVHDGPWFDIGTPRRYVEASHSVRKMMLGGLIPLPTGSRAVSEDRSIVHDSSVIEGAISSSVAGRGSAVEAGGSAGRAILWDGSRVERGGVVLDSIVAENVIVPAGTRIEHSLICSRIEGTEYPEGARVEGNLVIVPIG